MITQLLRAAVLVVPLALGACSIAPPSENAPLLNGPSVQKAESPFAPALACLKSKLTPEQKSFSVGVVEFPDRTGKFAVSSESATGNFSTQGAQDALTDALHQIGMRVVETGAGFRSLVDWYNAKSASNMVGDGVVRSMRTPDGKLRDIKYIPLIQGTLMSPNLVITGSIDSLDFLPGGGAELYVGGVGGGYRQYRILVGMEGRMIKMPVGTQVGGEVVTSEQLTKQVVADETKAGVARFFGSTFVQFDIGSQRREALQYVELEMTKYMAYRLVSDYFGIHDCDGVMRSITGVENPKGS